MPELRQSEPVGRMPEAPPLTRRQRLMAGADRIADAYGLVLMLVMTTVVLASLLPGTGLLAAVTVFSCNLTAVVALTTSRAPVPRVQRAVGVLIATTFLASLSALLDVQWMLGLAYSGAVILLARAMAAVLVSVVTVQQVDSRTLLGAVSVYTSMGVLFTFVYKAVDRFQPGPFFQGDGGEGGGDFIFFSYTTLTTTGYGNLVPLNQPGKLFALLEMLTGQIFLVTLVAGLVTLWRPPRSRK